MKLYSSSQAPSARRVTMYLAEKGITVDTVEIDVMGGEQLGDDYRRINPDCMVPCLALDDGEVISESMAICRYFEALHPEPPLFGTNPRDIASIEMWGRFCEINGFLAVGDFLRNSFKPFAGRGLPGPVDCEQIPALAERARLRYAYFLERINERLAGRDWLATDSFSNADITGFIAVDAGNMFKLPLDPAYTDLQRWYAACGERPSAKG